VSKKGRDSGGEKEGWCRRKREREGGTERGRGGVRERGGKYRGGRKRERWREREIIEGERRIVG
jgi:hypothetical protein